METPRKQLSVNQQQSSYDFTETEAACTRPALGPLCLYYNFQFSVFMGFLSVQMNEFLIIMPSLRLFFFFLLVCLFNLDVIIFI